MRIRLIYSLLSLTVWTCSNSNEEYFVGQNTNLLGLAGTHYVLGQVKSDSIRLWILGDDVACGCYFGGASETIPLREYTGMKFTIKELNDDKITIIHDKETFTLKKRAKLFHELRNELTVIKVNSSYEDSIKNILQVRNLSNQFLPGIQPREVRRLVESLDSKVFESEYARYLDKQLVDIKIKARKKKKNYELLTTNQITIDSTYFKVFLSDYSHSYYDQKSVHYILTTKPELFYTIEQKVLDSDICCCETCFTQDELEEMYCMIKPLSYKKRFESELWPFERHGNLKCAD
jgi:hypothetical protein